VAKALWRWKKEGQEEEAPTLEEPSEAEQPSEPSGQTERERQLHGLAVLSLFLHSTATIEEMMAMLLEQAPTVTGAVFVYPLLLDRKRQLIRASILEGTTDPKLEAAMEAFQEDLTALEFSLVRNQDLYRILEGTEFAGKIVLFDATTTDFKEVNVKRDPDCPVCSDRPTITTLVEEGAVCDL